MKISCRVRKMVLVFLVFSYHALRQTRLRVCDAPPGIMGLCTLPCMYSHVPAHFFTAFSTPVNSMVISSSWANNMELTNL